MISGGGRSKTVGSALGTTGVIVRVAVADIVDVLKGVSVRDANDVEVQIEVDLTDVVVLVTFANAVVRVGFEIVVAVVVDVIVGLGTIVREANGMLVGFNWVSVGSSGKLSHSSCVEVLVQPATAMQSTMIDSYHRCLMGCLLGLVSRWPVGLHL